MYQPTALLSTFTEDPMRNELSYVCTFLYFTCSHMDWIRIYTLNPGIFLISTNGCCMFSLSPFHFPCEQQRGKQKIIFSATQVKRRVQEETRTPLHLHVNTWLLSCHATATRDKKRGKGKKEISIQLPYGKLFCPFPHFSSQSQFTLLSYSNILLLLWICMDV